MISESYWSRISQDNEIYNFDFYLFLPRFFQIVIFSGALESFLNRHLKTLVFPEK